MEMRQAKTIPFRAERGSRSSSIPATPAPTPNPLLYVSNGVFRPEQLAAGISSLRDGPVTYDVRITFMYPLCWQTPIMCSQT